MAVSDSVAYEVIALHLQHRDERLDHDEFLEAIDRVVSDVETTEDVFELVLGLGGVAAGAIAAAAIKLGRTPEAILQEAALASAVEENED
ncbi:hypothetical protein [Nocardioides dongkuii]|uniref:hypothetical protein n=1 Tax=Nocardioides dongkuii TaxID=2760089 RepID=UPI0015F9D9F8|nr:hypothetical protein [Nocardioides dongkuii]